MTLRLLLDEWYFTVGQQSPAALPSFVDAFVLEALAKPASLVAAAFDEQHAYAKAAVPLLDFRRDGLLKQLALKLDAQSGVLGAVKALLEQCAEPGSAHSALFALVKGSALSRTLLLSR